MENITDIVNIDQTYQQPIQSSTNVSHETAIRNVLENAFNSQTEAYNDEKERIKVIIIEEITERKSNLLQVKNCIEREYEKSLSSIDNAYIEQKYMKYCTELWMEKVTALVQATTECNDTKLIQTILSSIDKIKTLSDIPESFKQLEYYKNLVDHYHFISENKKKNLIISSNESDTYLHLRALNQRNSPTAKVHTNNNNNNNYNNNQVPLNPLKSQVQSQ
ncbi:integrator complex subunit 11 homolog [Teleopsis dalmanni]|uniref:integrator complex subunit 11 homolog n=1 Tax=Teleopsis dalmanni TaxID=139649 RepID=UPI0018CCDF33|nr:integrator complex subunit 11 homolog [Teleopsis dalmanni]